MLERATGGRSHCFFIFSCESRDRKGGGLYKKNHAMWHNGENTLMVVSSYAANPLCCQGNERKQFEQGKKPHKHLFLVVKWVNYIFRKLISRHMRGFIKREKQQIYALTRKCVYMLWESLLCSVYHRLWSTRRCTRRMLKANLLSTIPFLSLLKGNNYPALALSVCCRARRAVLRSYSVFVHAGSKINSLWAPNATKNWLCLPVGWKIQEMQHYLVLIQLWERIALI